ncbi:MAG: YggS family pyridoxal phosphate-dependent enzyme [Beutenbergiaceae bacterium]
MTHDATGQHDSLHAALATVRARIAAAARTAQRDPDSITLLLAVKTLPATRIREAIAAGGTLIGQNRAQELTATEPQLEDLPHQTHFIGHLQSNKAGQVSRWVDCVQTVDSIALAQRLNRVQPQHSSHPLGVMVQVNTSAETTKSGVSPTAALELAADIAQLPALHLRGFMTIGANSPDTGRVRASYEALAHVRASVHQAGIAGAEDAQQLSMGMSGDLELAIGAGATMIRVGSAIFGARPPGPPAE